MSFSFNSFKCVYDIFIVSGADLLICFSFSLVLGVYEALELRDGGSDYLGKGVSKVSAIDHRHLFHQISNYNLYML